jgi:hypothetical protein
MRSNAPETVERAAVITGSVEWAALLAAARPVVDTGNAHTRCHCTGYCEHLVAWRGAVTEFERRLRALNPVRLAHQLHLLSTPAAREGTEPTEGSTDA